jgi:hypothetical protein
MCAEEYPIPRHSAATSELPLSLTDSGKQCLNSEIWTEQIGRNKLHVNKSMLSRHTAAFTQGSHFKGKVKVKVKIVPVLLIN